MWHKIPLNPAAKSLIRTDAQATSDLWQGSKIIQQAGTAMLAQASQSNAFYGFGLA
jgi:flagellin-like hook-associated protein FlgL